MKIEDLTVALRPRNSWEAVELGTALTRRHFGAVLRPWLAVTLPVLIALNLGLGLLGVAWLAGLVMWWLKPVFDRVPLYVYSRALFGQAPATWPTVRAQLRWGLGWMPAYLTWRRLSPWRSLNLPVDLLEGGGGAAASARRSALIGPLYAVGAMVTLLFLHFEFVVLLGLATLGLLFVPNDSVEQVALSYWRLIAAQPTWLQVAFNVVHWLAMSCLEPFYVGAGFGLYLNRRTQIECWDLEMVLRRLRARLVQASAPALLLVAGVLALGAAPAARAVERPGLQQDPPAQQDPAGADAARDAALAAQAATRANPHQAQPTLQEVFGEDAVRDEGWEQSVKRAYEDPKVSPRQVVSQWVARDRDKPRERSNSDWGWLADILALIAEYGIWVLVGLLALALLLTSPRWLRWLRDTAAVEGREPSPVVVEAVAPPEPLPADVPAEALRLWRSGHERDALALMYRASVEDMARRANVVLVPGATEAHTLRASRKLPRAEDREVFARTVRTWQYAAYAHGLPSAQDFEALLRALVAAFGWHTTATGLGPATAEGAA